MTDDLTALQSRWRLVAALHHASGNELDHVRESQSYEYGTEHALASC